MRMRSERKQVDGKRLITRKGSNERTSAPLTQQQCPISSLWRKSATAASTHQGGREAGVRFAPTLRWLPGDCPVPSSPLPRCSGGDRVAGAVARIQAPDCSGVVVPSIPNLNATSPKLYCLSDCGHHVALQLSHSSSNAAVTHYSYFSENLMCSRRFPSTPLKRMTLPSKYNTCQRTTFCHCFF